MLDSRFRTGRRPEDIDEAVALLDQALELVPRHHPKRAELLPQLVMHLGVRFRAYRRLEDFRRMDDIRQGVEGR
jgi:hypothetical protein